MFFATSLEPNKLSAFEDNLAIARLPARDLGASDRCSGHNSRARSGCQTRRCSSAVHNSRARSSIRTPNELQIADNTVLQHVLLGRDRQLHHPPAQMLRPANKAAQLAIELRGVAQGVYLNDVARQQQHIS